MLDCQKDKFTLPEGIHYLNCAYMSPMLRAAEKAGIEAIKTKRNPSEITSEDFFTSCNEIRNEFSKLIGHDDPNAIAIIPSVSYGIANAARNISLSKGDEIMILAEQFPSNVYPWYEVADEYGAQVVEISVPDGDQRGARWNDQIMNSIGPKTKIVAMGHAHWTDGTVFDIKNISEKVHQHDGYLIIDGTQSVGALPFDVNEIKPDALICAGYKWLLSPYGIGMAYYNERFQNGKPIENNWINRRDSEDFAGLVNYKKEFQPGSQRFDVGERSNFILSAMQLVTLRQVNQWGISEIQDYCRKVSKEFLEEVGSVGFQLEDDSHRASHLFGIRISKDIPPKSVAAKLKDHNISVSVRGSAIRVSPHLYNEKGDFEALLNCLKTIS